MKKSETDNKSQTTRSFIEFDEDLSEIEQPHRLEREVSRHLSSQPGLKFSSLVVHRTPGGVCLEGNLETLCDCDEVTRLALQVAGVDEVLNRLVLCDGEKCSAE